MCVSDMIYQDSQSRQGLFCVGIVRGNVLVPTAFTLAEGSGLGFRPRHR
jgi:hypothetical protein